MDKFAIILAAGKGTRMKSSVPKVLHKVAGRAMVDHVLTNVEASGSTKNVVVIGHGSDLVEAELAGRAEFVLQAEQLGTGHAVIIAEPALKGRVGLTLIIAGDTPLIDEAAIEKLFADHVASGNKATILTAEAPNPTGYGRIIRDADGQVLRIVEQKDGSADELAVREINTGTFVFDNIELFDALDKIGNDNAQGEYYLTDAIEIIRLNGGGVGASVMADFADSLGVNDRVALNQAEELMQAKLRRKHMINGVTFTGTPYLESDVVIGNDTIIEGNVALRGATVIGSNSVVTSGSDLTNAKVGSGVTITSSHIENAIVEDGVDMGPWAHIRPGSIIRESVHLGNFIETNRSEVGARTKAGHFAYMGDVVIGEDCNVSCGVTFANFDGKFKHKSAVGDRVFIGSESTIINPVTIGDDAFVAGDSIVTEDVPAHAMAIGRARQTNKEGYADKLNYRLNFE
ncbi:MAG: bifunctional UDP-N-acetylglucosamine diphosphorylase/glucosamine-1-phosphate N-acetyltransferase GlmU [Lactobacillales bacterium]|jgi:bifunctional UDP-N-acetylglucosamine pyrophosphorylase/glucosamine-1-phosphate N-acetyltransferase|nr:bifunctional UDP-N-acetylglucosamine diphosphorylase/glucosamine-1-phosphate N-acetyltransferase GlmU [Lactobacillales bacterium]